ncbi:MAG: metallophosphoesterase [Dysgonamonadaceae bacterium]|jgi:hypothetical protein|nr:metallophosphoesterase [Dysgonamonadaceae bacterium]
MADFEINVLFGNDYITEVLNAGLEEITESKTDALQSIADAEAAANAAITAAGLPNDVYNVTARVPLAAGSYYTAATARAAVPTAIRKAGLVITYETAAGVWATEQYTADDTSAWTTDTNWKAFGGGALAETIAYSPINSVSGWYMEKSTTYYLRTLTLSGNSVYVFKNIPPGLYKVTGSALATNKQAVVLAVDDTVYNEDTNVLTSGYFYNMGDEGIIEPVLLYIGSNYDTYFRIPDISDNNKPYIILNSLTANPPVLKREDYSAFNSILEQAAMSNPVTEEVTLDYVQLLENKVIGSSFAYTNLSGYGIYSYLLKPGVKYHVRTSIKKANHKCALSAGINVTTDWCFALYDSTYNTVDGVSDIEFDVVGTETTPYLILTCQMATPPLVTGNEPVASGSSSGGGTTVLVENVITRNKHKESKIMAHVATGAGMFSFLHCSDSHYSYLVQHVTEFANKYLPTAIIHTGDSVESYTTGSPAYTDAMGADSTPPFFLCVGNHEVLSATSDQQIYDRYFANIEAQMGLPAAMVTGCYYYRDFATELIRMIVINTYTLNNAQAQADWFVQTLLSTPAGYAVVIFLHISPRASTTPDPDWVITNSGTSQSGSQANAVFAAAVQAFIDGTSFNLTGENSITASGDFTSRGAGLFAGWFFGHGHVDYSGYITAYPNQRVTEVGAQGTTQTVDNLPRTPDTVCEDSFNLCKIDVSNRRVHILKIGADRSVTMQPLEYLSYTF